MYSDGIEVKEEKSSITFETVLSNFTAEDDLDLREQLAEASVLVIPHMMKYEGRACVFPEGTVNFYRYLQENSPDNVMINIATKDDEYIELVQHSTLIQLATIITSAAVAPVLLNLISNYIYDKIKQEGSRVKCKILIDNADGSSISIDYNGPAKEYENTINEVLKKDTNVDDVYEK